MYLRIDCWIHPDNTRHDNVTVTTTSENRPYSAEENIRVKIDTDARLAAAGTRAAGTYDHVSRPSFRTSESGAASV
jgi:hypothetical protein